MAVFRYEAGILQWKKSELKDVDSRSSKTMTMYGALHPKSNVDRLCIERKDWGRGRSVWNMALEKSKIVWVFMLPILKKT